MKVLQELPKLSDLKKFISLVPRYPITANEVVELAKRRADHPIIEFYSAFPPDLVFADHEDLLARSEQVEVLNAQDQPLEEYRVPEED